MKSINLFKTPLNTQKVVKKFWFIPLIILLLAIVIVSIFGMNLSLDFAKGQQFYVEYNTTLEDDVVKEYVSDIKTSLKDNGINTYSVEYVENNITSRIIIKFKDLSFKSDDEMTAIANTIRDEIADSLNIDLTITENYTETVTSVGKYYPPYSTINFLYAGLIVVGLIAVMFVYAWIRFGITQALTTFLSLVFDVFMIASFLILCRIPVYITIVIPFITAIFISSIFKFVFFDKQKEIVKLDIENKYTDADYVNIAFEKLSKNNTIIIFVIAVLFFLFLFIGILTSIWYMLPLLFALVCSVVSTIYVTFASWIKIYKKEKDKRLQEKKQKTEKDEVVV